MKKIVFSVIIPVRTITPYVRETVSSLKKQSFKDFEIVIITDKRETLAGTIVIASGEPTPAYKRNLGVKKTRGKYLAFLDDDSYPAVDWLKNALSVFKESDNTTAVCGPTLTPPADNVYQKASGWVWASWLGSASAGVYRNRVRPRREVDDFPSVNLIVRKDDFVSVEGFDINHWPGEDTKLCLDLVKTGKKIIYDPKVLVYHHRRAVFLPHLKQISRYAMRRGHFARIFPETSLRVGYFLPSVGAYGLVFGAMSLLLFPVLWFYYLLIFICYLLLLTLSGIEAAVKEKNIRILFLVMAGIFLTHLTYGFLFPLGYFQKRLKITPHQVDPRKKVYVGG